MCHHVSLTPLTVIPVIISSSVREDRLTDAELGKSETDRRATGGHGNNNFVPVILCMCTLAL